MTVAARLPVTTQADAEQARRTAVAAAATLGFSPLDQAAIALATMELASNLVRYATEGEILLSEVSSDRGLGLQIESRDTGPGIADLERAIADGMSTGGGLGNGLPAVRRLMETFEVHSSPGQTTVIACKWRRPG